MNRFAIVLGSLALWVTAASAAGMSQTDRDHVVAHLQMTGSWLADEVSGLSPAQLNYRYAPGKWTILEVLEHLVIAEPMYLDGIRKSIAQAPAKSEKPSTDAAMLWYGIDRTNRQKTQKDEEPVGKLKDAQAGLDSFRKLRASILEYARTTDDDLRAHLFTDWGVDSYQGILGISTHSQRHILQIREIKAQPGYPKK